MLDSEQLAELEKCIRALAEADGEQLEEMRREVRGLGGSVRPIRPRTTTSVSLVSADAGENVVQFDPYLVMPLRVVDSHGQVLFLDVLSPFMDVAKLNQRHLDHGEARTPLGRLMTDLGVRTLWDLSPMIPDPGTPRGKVNPSWIRVYRDLGEWAALYEYLTGHTFVSHTLVIRDGFLRSKIFARNLFVKMWERIEDSLSRLRRETGRKVFLVGVAKRSKVIERYQLAMYLEGVVVQPGPCYVQLPREIEQKVYRWAEYARGVGEVEHGEEPKFVVGTLFLAKFGPKRYDPIWPVDVWNHHLKSGEVDEIFGYLLADAQAGFPRPFYPLCLQQAHEKASLSGLDMEILQDAVIRAAKGCVEKEKQDVLDLFWLASRAGGEKFRGG
ncbi:MAG: hypothetical protein ACPLPR_06065 [Bacillota bacterium]